MKYILAPERDSWKKYADAVQSDNVTDKIHHTLNLLGLKS